MATITNGNTLDATTTNLHELVSAVTSTPYRYLEPNSALQDVGVAAAKGLLDALAGEIVDEQTARKEQNRRKRKRGYTDDGAENVLQLRRVHTEGLGVNGVWEQCRRILDAACQEVERGLAVHETEREVGSHDEGEEDGVVNGDDESVISSALEPEQDFSDDEDLDREEDKDIDLNGDEVDDYEEDPEDGEDIDVMEEDEQLFSDEEPSVRETYLPDPNNLNDGFFDIEDFNKQTQFLEQQDVRGEDDDRSDEDDIDWDADPLTMAYPQPKPGKRHAEDEADIEEDDDDEDEDDGPTFEDGDLNASDDDEPLDEDAGLDTMPGLSNTNDIRYTDFFEPPPKKLSKTKRMRALPKTQPPQSGTNPVPSTQNDNDTDLDRAIADVRRDILDSDSEHSDSPNTKDANPSTHEKQRASITAEIRRLEAASVAKRDWTLSGEARAADRPVNSLIEEDFAFERTGKPVPVITNEVSEEIEQLIKRRILAREFDEVLRRRPDASSLAGGARRGRVELDDTKNAQGLAEIYETEYSKRNDPNFVGDVDKKTARAHEEIGILWKEVRSQLEVLSNLHFKPRRPDVQIKSVEDVKVVSMQDARPVGGDDEGAMLAPQEVYRPGEMVDRAGEKGRGQKGGKGDGVEVVTTKGGVSLNKEELTREEKVRRRRRDKERIKKGRNSRPGLGVGGAVGAASTPGDAQSRVGGGKVKKPKKDEQQGIIEQLKKGNVQVIGKKGDLESMGKEKRSAGAGVAQSGGAYKL